MSEITNYQFLGEYINPIISLLFENHLTINLQYFLK